ncbi:NAD(P)/FAD-dependent oxidoreductase [Actinomadura rugatobispora]|uniref:NAD(P)/FAD-dependent oxidoreductase n=1 Tax=Actinomadura rugatobispora TaxID=1994 RepID=A0ABW1AHZ6_9ACTN
MRSVVVVGGGAAGVAAVETLRREGYDGVLTLLCGEPMLPYDRPPLSKQVLTGTWDHQRTRLRERRQYSDLGVQLLHARARELDPGRRTIRLDDGTGLDYDGAVIATGVRPRRLPGASHLTTGVHVLRDRPDATEIRTAFEAGGRVVIVGAGFLGLEVAAAARGMGLDVTVVEPLEHPMLRQVGPEIAPVVAGLHRERGVKLRLGVGVGDIRDEDGRVTTVELTDGTSLPADCVLVSIGAVPEVDWLRGSGLPLGDGIECDEFCKAAPGVYAAGDVASWFNPRYGRRMRLEHRMNATEQGTAAARNLLHGDDKPFSPLPYFWTDQYDVKIQAHGVLPADAEVTIEEGTPADGKFVASYRSEGRLMGVLAWNAPKLILPFRKLLLEEQAAR